MGVLGRGAGVAIAVGAGALYWLAGPDQGHTDSHSFIAAAMLEGRLHLDGIYPWLELVPRAEGGWYSPFPPLPAVVLMPFVALERAGLPLDVDTNLPTAVAGAVAVWLMWRLLAGMTQSARIWMTVAFAVGSELLWVAATGGQHLFPQVLAAALFLGAINLARMGRVSVLAGLLLGLAAAARLPVGLALPLLVWWYRDRRSVVGLLVGVAAPALLVAAYNVARFGSPFEFGYGLITDVAGHRVLDEPWYSEGIISPAYLPLGLYTMLLRSFDFVSAAPWLRPSHDGTSVLLTMPVLLWLATVRGRDAIVALGVGALIMAPNLMHGVPGSAQFGYRFILDALPILWAALAWRFREGLPGMVRVALAIGVVANVYGMVAFWGLGFVG